MQLYSIIVTLHILTATGMFMAWAAEWVVGSIGVQIGARSCYLTADVVKNRSRFYQHFDNHGMGSDKSGY